MVYIGDEAFMGCVGLSNIKLPNNLISIGYRAFCLVAALTSTTITIPDNVESIGYGAFSFGMSLTEIMVTPNNRFYTVRDGVLFDKAMKTLMAYPGGKYSISYTVPDGVTNIGADAFFQAQNLISVSLPDGLLSIGNGAFFESTYLETINIPNSITHIAEGAFGASGLRNINIPMNVISIGERAFAFCENLTDITIPNSVTSIGDYAFSFLQRLSNVTIPNSVTHIGKDAFWGSDSVVINCYNNSSAHTFAVQNSIKFSLLDAYNITATASPAGAGTVTGAGTYRHGANVTVRAAANTGFVLDGWYENNAKVPNANASYSFIATRNRTLEARFVPVGHTVAVAAGTGGRVSGGGTVNNNTNVTVGATANKGFTFDGWFENGKRVSGNARFTFKVTKDRTLEARFVKNPARPASFKVTRNGRKARVTWRRQTGARVEIQHRIGNGKWRTVRRTAAGASSWQTGSLSRRRKHSYRIRAYRTTGGRAIRSAWTARRSVDIK